MLDPFTKNYMKDHDRITRIVDGSEVLNSEERWEARPAHLFMMVFSGPTV